MKSQKSVNFAKSTIAAVFTGVMLYAWPVFAHEPARSVEDMIRSITWITVTVTSIFLGVMVLILLWEKHRTKNLKWLFFLLMVIPILLTSFYLASSTIFLNLISETKGPVHWHAEFKVFKCGEELDLVDPRGLTNRVGTPLLHGHGDNWIHIEGVPLRRENVSLHHFFEDVGGELENDRMLYPTTGDSVYAKNGDVCPDGQPGRLQVFLFAADNGEMVQTKLDNFADYVISPHAAVPPGDCLIIEFAPEKEKTDNICERYQIALDKGELTERE